MEILVLLLLVLLPYEIFGQAIYRKQVDPNNAPFLPINPGFPYTSKVTKRGSEKESSAMLNSELYAPRPDAMDSYTSSFSASQEKIPYFSGYGGGAGFPGAGFPRAPYSPFSPYYGNNIFGLFSSPYGNPYASGINGYFNEPAYFYQDYYNNPYNSYPHPHPEFHGPRGPPSPPSRIHNPNPVREYDNHVSTDTVKYDETKTVKPNESHEESNDEKKESENHYVDGNNSVSENQKEVVAQRASSSSTNNERDKTEDYQFKISHLPPPTYKVISVGGQPVGPDYPLPESYTRAKLLEQVAAVQSLVKSLGPALTLPQVNRAQDFRSMSSEYHHPHMSSVTTKDKDSSVQSPIKNDYYLMDGNHNQVKMNDARYFPLISTPQSPQTDPHVYGIDGQEIPSKDPAAPSNQFIFNADLAYDEERDPEEAGKKSEDESEELEIDERERNVEPIFLQSNSMRGKTSGTQRYAVISNVPKMTSASASERSQGGFIPSENVRPVMEETSDGIQEQSPSSSSSSSSRDPPYRSEENYQSIRGRVQIVGNSYNRAQNGDHGVPQAYTYHITKMHPSSRTGQQQEATNLEDVNFGTEQGNKG